MILTLNERYRLVEENDERIDERLRPRLRLEVIETGEILFDAHSTSLEALPQVRLHGGIWLELNHAGERVNVLIDPDDRTFQAEPHDHGRPLDALTGFLSEMRLRPPTYATRRQIIVSALWLVVNVAFVSLFIWMSIVGPRQPRDWWKIALGLLLFTLFTWANVAELRTLLRRPRQWK